MAMPGLDRVPAHSTALSRGSFMLLNQVSSSHSIHMVGHTVFGGSAESYLIPLPSLYGVEGFYFPGFVPPNDRVNFESVEGIRPVDSGLVIGY